MPGDRAVLTGAFLRPARVSPEATDASFAVLADAAREAAAWHSASLRLTRFQGEGWQCLLAEPGLCLRTALFLQARLRAGGAALETQIAVGIGPIDRPGATDLTDAAGAAFRRADTAIDAMRRGRRICLARDGARPPAPVLFTLADAISQRWTTAQAEVLIHALLPDPPTQAEIAKRLGTKQQNIAARLDAAGFWALSEAMTAIELVLGRKM